MHEIEEKKQPKQTVITTFTVLFEIILCHIIAVIINPVFVKPLTYFYTIKYTQVERKKTHRTFFK